MKRFVPLLIVVVCFLATRSLLADETKSLVVEREIQSKNFSQNKIGTSAVRKLMVYLPPGYEAGGSKRYPVIYYPDDFDEHKMQKVFDDAIASGTIRPFILVAVNMMTPLGPSWCVNSPVTGNWDDFFTQELVPYIDSNFKTLANRNSRGITGNFIGAYCAIRLGMEHPDIFGAVYGMHPVGTGSGVQLMDNRPNWDLLASAKTLDDVKKDGFTQLFTTIFQAHLPDVNKPPLYIDLVAHKEGDRLVIDSALTDKLRNNFLLETMIPKYADNLKSLRGFKFDWARSDTNEDHIYSNQAFTHKLNEFGIIHEAEEYNGTWGESYWGSNGRVSTEVLPFFQRTLAF